MSPHLAIRLSRHSIVLAARRTPVPITRFEFAGWIFAGAAIGFGLGVLACFI